MKLELDGRVAVVTGGDSGIGAACAVALAEAGADVAILYHSDADHAAETCRKVEAAGRKGLSIKADVATEADVEQAFDRTREALGAVSILVNSAGVNMKGVAVVDMSLDQWQKTVATDLTGSFLTGRRFVRDWKSGGPAAIINITSIHAEVMRAGGADYDAAKGGQRNLTRTLALEVADRGITVNAIAPGMILTPMNQEAMDDEKQRKEAEQHIPARRAGKPEEVAGVAVFLASPAASYITGSTVTIDGGLSLQLGLGA